MSWLSPSEPSESELEELSRIAVRHYSSVFDGIVPPDGDRVTFELEGGDHITFEIEEVYCKDGPASKAVTITEEEAGDCAICLIEYLDGEEVKEMPCKHRYHSGCICKWLKIHGSCPLCRYEMSMDSTDGEEPTLVLNFFIQRAGQSDL